MYAVTSKPEVRRTRATLRSAELGFFGVEVYTRVQTPRRSGQDFKAGDFVLALRRERSVRISCWMVGIEGRCAVGRPDQIRQSDRITVDGLRPIAD